MGKDKRKWGSWDYGKKKAKSSNSESVEQANDDDDDDNVDEREQHGDTAHAGSFTLEELKTTEEYNRRIDSSDFPKKKWAVNFGYVGSAYQGLQINPGADSVEKHLERALFLAGGIAECNWGCLHKLQWSRTARTDRGVHAVMQCCAMKLLIAPNSRPQFIENVNSLLPSDIRVHAIARTTKNFNSKLSCSGRQYEYLLPTYLLQDKDIILTELQTAFEQQGPLIDVARSGGYADAGSDRFLGPTGLGVIRQKLMTFRIDTERLEVVRKALRCFEGTKSYHNFTTGKTPTDANAKRYITSFLCSDPFVDPLTQTDWLIFSIVGQSFLLNQIRKMVGMVVEVASGKTSLQVAEASLTAVKVEIPMAPGVGLYLDELYFKAYNLKQNRHTATRMAPRGSTHESSSSSSSSSSNADTDGDEGGEKLDWTETSTVKTTMTAFKQDVIWPHIMQEEREKFHFLYYLDNLRVHPYHFHIKEFKSNDESRKKEEIISSDVK